MTTLSQKYKLLKNIGSGSFSSVFLGESILTKKKVAIKMELKELQMLKREAQIYQILCDHSGIPKIKYYGSNEKYNFLVLPFLGKSLNNYRYSLKQSIDISKKMLDIIEYVHSKGFLHRDLKPANFLFENNNIYLIDFGLAKKYLNEDGTHILIRTEKSLVGSVNFSSVNVQQGFEASRRDDIESILYILLFILKENSIPWKNCRPMEVLEKKLVFSEQPVANLLSSCRTLQFEEKPNYSKFVINL